MNNHINYFGNPFISNPITEENSQSFFPAQTALANGTIYKGIYEGYKHYLPRPIVLNNTIEGLERTIQAYYFSLNDLTLYLDVHPDDEKSVNKFNEYVKEFNNAMNEYIKINGPVNIYSKELNPWIWNKVWPWEGRRY